MKRIGYIDARRVRYVVDGVTKFAINSWGIIMGCVTGSMSLYLAADYGAYITSILAGELDLCGANAVNIRISGPGEVLSVTGTAFNLGISLVLAQGLICAGTGRIRLLMTDVDSAQEGDIWYHASTGKLRFRTSIATEVVTSS